MSSLAPPNGGEGELRSGDGSGFLLTVGCRFDPAGLITSIGNHRYQGVPIKAGSILASEV